MNSKRPQRRIPAQSRAEATRRAIREASLRILCDEGPERLTTNRIVERHRTLYRQLKGFYLDIHWRYDLERWMAEYRAERTSTADWLPAVFERHRGELPVRDPGLAAATVVNAITGTIHATLDANPALILDDRFCAELHGLVLAYLKSPTPARA